MRTDPWQAYDAVAKLYGRSVNPEGWIMSPKGARTDVKLKIVRNRLRCELHGGLLFSSPADPENIGKFLELFYCAERIE